MARNSSGTYSLPAGNPVVTGTTVSSTTNNNTMSDVATELTDSLSRSNKGAMLAALTLNAGAAVGTPDLTWNGDSDTGLYRIGANDIGVACGGSKILEVTTTVFTALADVLIGSAKVILDTANSILKQTASNSSLTLKGNRSAADTGSDLVTTSTATRTAGNLHDFQNNTTSKLSVDYSGQLKWPSAPASTATTPGPSAVTNFTYNASWTSDLIHSSAAGYWKDAMNMVHLRGSATNGTGSGQTSPFNGGLPAGFRPTSGAYIPMMNGTPAIHICQIAPTGAITIPSTIANGATAYFDGISFLAEA